MVVFSSDVHLVYTILVRVHHWYKKPFSTYCVHPALVLGDLTKHTHGTLWGLARQKSLWQVTPGCHALDPFERQMS
jgi:hypothetical protein